MRSGFRTAVGKGGSKSQPETERKPGAFFQIGMLNAGEASPEIISHRNLSGMTGESLGQLARRRSFSEQQGGYGRSSQGSGIPCLKQSIAGSEHLIQYQRTSVEQHGYHRFAGGLQRPEHLYLLFGESAGGPW